MPSIGGTVSGRRGVRPAPEGGTYRPGRILSSPAGHADFAGGRPVPRTGRPVPAKRSKYLGRAGQTGMFVDGSELVDEIRKQTALIKECTKSINEMTAGIERCTASIDRCTETIKRHFERRDAGD